VGSTAKIGVGASFDWQTIECRPHGLPLAAPAGVIPALGIGGCKNVIAARAGLERKVGLGFGVRLLRKKLFKIGVYERKTHIRATTQTFKL